MGSNPAIEAAAVHEAEAAKARANGLTSYGIDQKPARQATERPKQTTVVDACGQQLRVGDRVKIDAVVEALNPEGYGCDVILRTEREMPAVASYGPHRSPIHLNGQQCVRVERGPAR